MISNAICIPFFLQDDFKPIFTDLSYMNRALHLASLARGQTRPNPIVGCVIVDKAGTVVGEGWHVKAGIPLAFGSPRSLDMTYITI
jgi:hypothetical protein